MRGMQVVLGSNKVICPLRNADLFKYSEASISLSVYMPL